MKVAVGGVPAWFASGAGFGWLALLASCQFGQPRLTPKDELRGVRVLLDADLATSASMPTSNGCSIGSQTDRQALLDSTRSALSAAGFAVVTSPAVEHEAVATVSQTCKDYVDNPAVREVKLGLEPGATVTAPSVYDAVLALVAKPAVLTLGAGGSKASRAKASEVAAPNAAKLSAAPFVAAAPQADAFAVIVGVGEYFALPPPAGARADGQHFAELCARSLGIPSDHVKLAFDRDATKGTVERLLASMDDVSAASRAYFYFSGYGTTDSVGAPYVLPTDGDPSFLPETALSVNHLLEIIARGRTKDALVILDAGFSGAGARSVPGHTRPLATGAARVAPAEHVALFASATAGEDSGLATDRSGGVFTKYVVSGLASGEADIDGDGQVTLDELFHWVSPRVTREAKRDGREQIPDLVLIPGVVPASAIAVEWGLPSK